MLVADHKPLVALYSSHSRSLPMCVARHKSRVACFNFDMIYEPGAKNPAMMRAHCEAECKAESVQAPGFQLSFVGCLKWTLCSEQNPFLMKEPLLYVLCLWKGCCIVQANGSASISNNSLINTHMIQTQTVVIYSKRSTLITSVSLQEQSMRIMHKESLPKFPSY